jgi:hypothetical protein
MFFHPTILWCVSSNNRTIFFIPNHATMFFSSNHLMILSSNRPTL